MTPLELDSVISVSSQNNEKGNDLKEIYHSQWTDKNDVFEI